MVLLDERESVQGAALPCARLPRRACPGCPRALRRKLMLTGAGVKSALIYMRGRGRGARVCGWYRFCSCVPNYPYVASFSSHPAPVHPPFSPHPTSAASFHPSLCVSLTAPFYALRLRTYLPSRSALRLRPLDFILVFAPSLFRLRLSLFFQDLYPSSLFLLLPAFVPFALRIDVPFRLSRPARISPRLVVYASTLFHLPCFPPSFPDAFFVLSFAFALHHKNIM
ncbi:hypothetical protein FB451DRAFT_445059 [Mycena latifolia]|nr:hypothetical protein FB451DRAFT_445059 [Mycena latifolia]